VLAIAGAQREEFGVLSTGVEGSEAGAVNNAFDAAARTIIAEVTTEGDDPATIVTQILRLAALRRLTELGVRPEQAEFLVSSEPKLRDS
jgi:hypothetical protein